MGVGVDKAGGYAQTFEIYYLAVLVWLYMSGHFQNFFSREQNVAYKRLGGSSVINLASFQ